MVDIHSEEYILGQNIRKYRLRLGWSQADLSNAVDIDRADISKEDLNIELLREEAEPEMVTAMVYIMENDFGRRSPSRYYYKVLHDGYKAFRFPMHILEGALKECMDKDAAQKMIKEVQA